VKLASLFGTIFFAALLGCFFYQEGPFSARGSRIRTTATPVYVHERYQRSYFSISDAQKLRQLHYEQAIALLGTVGCAITLHYSKTKKA